MPLLELADAPREVTKRLYERLKAYREREGVECDMLIVGGTTPKFERKAKVPKGWPPEG